MPNIPTHYDILKVPRDASTRAIHSAYRSLARKHHPDRRGDSPESQRAMQKLNAAYEVLSNPLTRAEHDRWIEAELGAHPTVEPPPGFESADPMESFLKREQPPRRTEATSTSRAVLSALLSGGYMVAALTLIIIPGARIIGVLMLIGGWIYYLNHHPRHRG